MIAMGADHAGFEAKESIKKYLSENKIGFKDFGTESNKSVDYPCFAKSVAESVAAGECEKGVLVCGTGIGVSIAANKVKGIRAALCHNTEYARMSRRHNDANILCIGGRTTDVNDVIKIVKVFLQTDFEGERHQIRVNQITQIENKSN